MVNFEQLLVETTKGTWEVSPHSDSFYKCTSLPERGIDLAVSCFQDPNGDTCDVTMEWLHHSPSEVVLVALNRGVSVLTHEWFQDLWAEFIEEASEHYEVSLDEIRTMVAAELN